MKAKKVFAETVEWLVLLSIIGITGYCLFNSFGPYVYILMGS
jgi:hypothetical protein